MMKGFRVNIDKAKAVILYIAERIGEPDFLKVFKILYFAEKEHLANYGRPIVGDTYIAMKNGPVPSFIYDALKYARGDGFSNPLFEGISNAVEVTSNYKFKAKEAAELDELSSSDIKCLDNSIAANRDLDFKQLSEKSHDTAWHEAEPDDVIDIIKIAKAGGANDEMVKYIEESRDYYNIAFA